MLPLIFLVISVLAQRKYNIQRQNILSLFFASNILPLSYIHCRSTRNTYLLHIVDCRDVRRRTRSDRRRPTRQIRRIPASGFLEGRRLTHLRRLHHRPDQDPDCCALRGRDSVSQKPQNCHRHYPTQWRRAP